jgi:ATP-dependent helicase/nuclease subunit B
VNLFTIPPGVPFLQALARWWLSRTDDPLLQSQGMILLPTRRAARALTEVFLGVAEGRPLLLPRIAAVGGLDEAPLALAGALELPPAVPEQERLAALTRLVMALEGRFGAPGTADRAWLLAVELARLLDEAHREGVDLGRVLPGLVDEGYAEHWADTLRFLQIVTQHWPNWLRDRGMIDPAARGVQLLGRQAELWREKPPGGPLVIAGTSGGIQALAGLMAVVARLPEGRVVLPGLDLAMPEPVWQQFDDSHPQAGLRALLAGMGAVRGDVELWPDVQAPARVETIHRSLLPARALSAWREPAQVDVTGLERLEAADQQEEAVAIALVLRQALETPGAQAALVTPDRVLAARVAAELTRFHIVVDDSAGEKLGETPPGAFLRLLVQSVAQGLSPVPLLAVLKHPLAGLGLRPADCRGLARLLERVCLRGPAPPPGIAGLRAAVAESMADHPAHGALAPELPDFIDRIEARFGPLLALAAAGDAAPAVGLRALIEVAEAVAETDDRPGAARLWALEEGEALAQHLAGLLEALPLLPKQPVGTLPGLLDASFENAVVRSRRALRGRQADEHPRVAILGLLEARLQSFDVLVLGSLAEAVWPPAADPGPWMSRPMRKAAGLASPEMGVGQMAHDFAMLACAAPHVVLSCPRRRDGAPTVPARWLVRLEAYLKGHGMALARSPAAAWARQLDQPDREPAPVRPPRPKPPVAARPRKLSVTEVETWLRDPYGIYARHVLGLRALNPLEQGVENADFGNLVHHAIAVWIGGLPSTYPQDAAARLRAAMEETLTGRALRPALVAWWRPRLARIADWVAAQERLRRVASPNQVLSVEVAGDWVVPAPGQPFRLVARADRIEMRPDGRLSIMDYKTGVVPAARDVAFGHAPQLPLEAAMVAAGAFGPALEGVAAELVYWRLTGGYVPGESTTLFKGDPGDTAEQAAQASAALVQLVRQFDDPAQAYLSQPHPGAAPRFTDYAQLARVGEWAVAEDE